MARRTRTYTEAELELRVDLLKERIYATLALLAVLLTIDTAHSSAWKAASIIGGTALSLWAASVVAAKMSYQVIMQKPQQRGPALERQVVRHSPLLAAAVFPLLVIGLAGMDIIGLPLAVDLAIWASLLLLFSWSLLSARAVRTSGLLLLLLAGFELVVGLAIVWLKTVVSH